MAKSVLDRFYITTYSFKEVSKKSTFLRWTEIGLLILLGVVLIVLFFNFSKATKWAITIGYVTAATIMLFASLIQNRRFVPTSQTAKPSKSKLRSASYESSKFLRLNHHHQFSFRLPIYSFLVLCIFVQQVLQRSGDLTPRIEGLLTLAVCVAVFTLGAAQLFWGLRERHVWLNWLWDIARDESPANYWTGICFWAIWTGGSAYRLASEFYKLISGQ